jgi:hypothetical protein
MPVARSIMLVATWTAGLAFIGAIIITFWPSRRTLFVASALWAIGALAELFPKGHALVFGGYMAYAFDSSDGFSLIAWLVPSLQVAALVIATVALLPSTSARVSRRSGLIAFLIYTTSLLLSHRFAFGFPFGPTYLFLPLLWLKIRAEIDANHQSA